eukprot:scaffold5234_cov131-Cylindrotheca_fusiformis.AAC.6
MVHFCLEPDDLLMGENKSSPGTAAAIINTVLLIGTKVGYQQHFDWACDQVLSKLVVAASLDNKPSKGGGERKAKKQKTQLNGEEEEKKKNKELLQSILNDVQPSLDSGSSTECYLARSASSASSKPLRVVLGVLPASVSRHNSPGQPHAVTALVKRHLRAKEATAILPLCTSKDHWFSVGCAIARVGGPLVYNRKTGPGRVTTMGGTSTTAGNGNGKGSSSVDDNGIDSAMAPEARVLFPQSMDKELQKQFAQLSTGIQLARNLVDQPCNELHTKAFMDQALESIRGLDHVSSRVIVGEELNKQGFGGLYNVGKAAEHPPALVILSYEPPSTKDQKSTVFVGKGIVFDTGGTQIKTKAGMPGMKRDMGGAAAMFSAFVTLATSGLISKRPLHAVLCLAENSVASNAMRPDDVIALHSGKTVEVNNTDAEGRLVLSDGVSSAISFLNPQTIIDMATLTGAQGIATGKYFGAIYSNDEELEQIAIEAGKLSGDLCHPVPYAPEFFRPEFASAVADMKNSVADRANAQVSCAGQFIGNHLGSFLEDGGQWMHVDMAYCVSGKDERATGYGVALLYAIVQKLEGKV